MRVDVKSISSKIDERISREKISQDVIDELTIEELTDLNKIVNIANLMLCKYEEKKTMKHLLKNFAEIIESTCEGIDEIDDEIAEMLLSTENSINKIKTIYGNMSDKTDITQIKGSSGM